MALHLHALISQYPRTSMLQHHVSMVPHTIATSFSSSGPLWRSSPSSPLHQKENRTPPTSNQQLPNNSYHPATNSPSLLSAIGNSSSTHCQPISPRSLQILHAPPLPMLQILLPSLLSKVISFSLLRWVH